MTVIYLYWHRGESEKKHGLPESAAEKEITVTIDLSPPPAPKNAAACKYCGEAIHFNIRKCPHCGGAYPSDQKTQRQNLTSVPPEQWRYLELEPPESEAEARRRGFDWNVARATLQKVAYGMVGSGVDPQVKAEFTDFMARFAHHDPLYQEVMKRLKKALAVKGSLIQSEIYKGQSERDKELARYVLYFAEILGDIERVKKGRSYLITLPSMDLNLTED